MAGSNDERVILYNYFRSSASYRARIGLNLKGIPYENRAIHLINNGGEQNSQDYKRLNPMGQVPYLVHGSVAVGQSLAILQYLDDLKPEPRLFPSNAKLRAQVWEICETINSGIQPLHNLAVLQELKSKFSATDDQTQQWAYRFINKGLTAMEALLERYRGTYAVGDQISAADICLVPQHYGSLRQQVLVEQYPNFHSLVQMLQKLPAFEKAHPDRQPQ